MKKIISVMTFVAGLILAYTVQGSCSGFSIPDELARNGNTNVTGSYRPKSFHKMNAGFANPAVNGKHGTKKAVDPVVAGKKANAGSVEVPGFVGADGIVDHSDADAISFEGVVKDGGKAAMDEGDFVPAKATAILYDAQGNVLKKKTYTNTEKLTEGQLMAKIEADGFKVDEKAQQTLTIVMGVDNGMEFIDEGVSKAPAGKKSDVVSGQPVYDDQKFADVDDFVPAVSADPARDVKKMVDNNVSAALIVANGKVVGRVDAKNGGKDICQIINIGTMQVDTFLKKAGIKDGANKKLKWVPAS